MAAVTTRSRDRAGRAVARDVVGWVARRGIDAIVHRPA
jgi:hypothetical protein